MGKRFSVTRSITIQRSPEDVYAFASDKRNDMHWRKGVLSMETDQAGSAAVGTQMVEVIRFMGRNTTTRSETTEAILNHKIAFRSLTGPFSVSGHRLVERTGQGTNFVYHLEGELSGLFSALSFVLAPLFVRQVGGDLERLKAHLERAPNMAAIPEPV